AFRVLPDNPFGRRPTGRVMLNGYRELRKVWRELKGMRRLRSYLAAFFVFNMGVQTVMYLAVTYAKQEVKDRDALGAVVPIGDESLIISILLIQLVAAVGAYLFVAFSGRWATLATLTIGCGIWIALCVAAYRVQWT